MAIPKYADPTGPYRSGQKQIDHEGIHVVENSLDASELNTAIDKVHRAGMPGVFAEVCDGDQTWRGAAGVADVSTGHAVTPDMRHRVGSISKTFTAATVLQQVESGQIGLDTPIGHYLPRLVPGERGNTITVRMLINHTSGLAEYLPHAYPSLKPFPRLAYTTPQSLDDHRFTRFQRTELIEMGVRAPSVGSPGGTPGIYSNTNYQILCQLLEDVPAPQRRSASPRTSLSALGSGIPSFRPDRMSAGHTRSCTRRGLA
jgi:D-alanyl-D-alanine carboxypeptidase